MRLKALRALSVKSGKIVLPGETFNGDESLIEEGLAAKADPPKTAAKTTKDAGA